MRIPLISSIALSCIPLAVVASHHGSSNARRHNAVALRQRGEVSKLQKRSYSGQATWFDVGLGACGQWSQSTDFVVALDTPLYGGGYPGPHCFASITITYNGISAQATIMDECPTCDYGSLDMSKSLFQHFAPLGKGVFPITWWYNDGSSGGGDGGGDKKTTKSPKPTPKWTPPPTPTSTTTKHTTTHHSTTTSTSDTTSTASKTSSADASGATDTPDNTANDVSPNNLSSFNEVLINFGALVVGAGAPSS